MSQRTDSAEFAPGFIWQISLLTIAVLCVVVASHRDFTWHLTGGTLPITPYPWVYGGGRTIANGLRAFSGQVPEPLPAGLRAAALVLVLINMVLCPTLFFLEWRRRELTKTLSLEHPLLRISSVFYALCGMITIAAGVGLGPAAYFSEKARADLRHAQAIQSNRDAMINQLNMLALDATQYRILPRQLGGGGRSFEGYSIPEKSAKTEEALYTVTARNNAAEFRATSAKYPLCAIEVRVDSLGQMGRWMYEGEFK